MTAQWIVDDKMSDDDVLVQYIIVRNDLIKQHNWSLGSLISNASHASISIIHDTYNDTHTQQYIKQENNVQMHTVTVAVSDEAELLSSSRMLKSSNILHTLWHEQPDNIHTVIATKPYLKSIIKPLLAHLRLFR